MKQSSKCAIGGIVAALSLVLMISVAVVPFLTYALPAIAGALIVFVVDEIGKKWALGVYASVAILGLFLVPDKEVAVMYLVLFGYYPIFKTYIDAKLNVIIGWVIKLVIFAGTMVGSYWLMIKFMGITVDEIDEYGKKGIYLLLGLGAVAFFMYDFAISRLTLVYRLKWRKYFKRYFK